MSGAAPRAIDAAAVVERFLAAERRGGFLTMLRMTTPDLVLRLPGEAPALGRREFRGRLRAAWALARIMRLSRFTMRAHPEEVCADGGDAALVRVRIAVRRRGEPTQFRFAMRFRLRGRRICEIDEGISPEELPRWQRFWS